MLALVLAAWCVAVAAGGHIVLRYSGASGPMAATASWPARTSLKLEKDRATLLLFVHPHCPCTRATASEFERLLAWSPRGSVAATVVYYQPRGRDAAWSRSAMIRRFEELPGVRVVRDVDAKEAERFGAGTSGTAMLYGPDGSLRFAGGITPGRGHEGDSEGGDAIAAVLRDRKASVERAPVFGCGLGVCAEEQ